MRRILAVAVSFSAVAAVSLLPVPAQTIESEEDLLDRLRELRVVLNMGAVAFDELDFARAVRDLSRILDPFEAGQFQLTSTEEMEVVARSLELRGRAYFNLGQTGRTDHDFETLIRLRVDYSLDRERISPKVIDRWLEVRSRIVGTVAVEVEPIGAEVEIDGQPAGLGPRLERDLLAGRHRVEVSLPGYGTVEESVEIVAGEITPLALTLARNARDIQLFTVPAGVEVFVDGESAGITSGTAPPEYEEMATRLSLPRNRISGPLLVRNLSPGDHRVRFSRPCYTAAAVRIEVELGKDNETPQDFRPIVLEPSEAELDVRSPTGAAILLDGRQVGRVPSKISGVCSGAHWVEIRMEKGVQWFEEIILERGDQRAIRARPRSTLLYLGVFSRGPDGDVRVITKGPLESGLRERGAFNLISGGVDTAPAESTTAGRSDQESPAGEVRQQYTYLRTLVTDTLGRAGAEIWRGTGPLDAPLLKRARDSMGADLVLAGTASHGGDGRVTLFLYETGSARPDRIVLEGGGTEKEWNAFLGRLTRSYDLYSTWFGAAAVDTVLTESPVVVRVSTDSPAARAGVEPGDQIRSAGGRPVRTRSELRQGVRKSRSDDRMAIQLRREGEDREMEIRLGKTPQLIPVADPDLLYNKLIAEFRLRIRTSRSEAEKNLLLLNLGLGLLHFREYGMAVDDGFRRVELPPGPGISYGTVQYYLGISYREMGNEPRAREALKRAAGATEATLGTHDGPLVALQAKRILQAMP
jgi:hypothetical protein